MPHSFLDEAIVLRTYNVGEADRFCILLTKAHGRIAARACGVRRLKSRRSGALLPFQTVAIECRQRTGGYDICSCTSLVCSDVSSSLHAFGAAQQAVELILRFTEEGVALPEIYALLSEFLSCCMTSTDAGLMQAFSVRLLFLLGLLPSFSHSCVTGALLPHDEPAAFSAERGGFCLRNDAPCGCLLSPRSFAWLRDSVSAPLREIHPLPPSLDAEITPLVHSLVGSQLGGSALITAPLAVSIVSGGTPISYVSDRVS